MQQPVYFWRLFTRSAGDDSFVPPGAIEMLSRSTPPVPLLVPSFPHSPSPPGEPSSPPATLAHLAECRSTSSIAHSPHSQDKAARCDVDCMSDRSRLPRWVLHMHSACWTASSTFSMKIRKHGPEHCKGKDFRFIPGHAAVQHIRRAVVKCCQCWRWPGQASAIDADPR